MKADLAMRTAACLCLAVGSVLIGGGCGIGSDSCRSRKSTSEIMTYECRRVDGRITVDGVPDEKTWDRATCISRFYEIRNPQSGGPLRIADDRFNVKILHDNDNLYIAAAIRDRDIVANPASTGKGRRDEDALMLDGDIFEVFIQPDPKQPLYYEFHINPLNAVWDARMRAGNYMYWHKPSDWKSNMVGSVKIDGTLNRLDEDRGWSVELVIPLRDITGADGKPVKIVPGTKWRMAFCLYDYQFYYDDCDNQKSLKFFSSSPFEQINYHERGYYNLVEFK